MLDKLTEWAADKPGVVVVRGRWQDVLPSLGTFDRVFFDDYPLDEPEDAGLCLRPPGGFAWSRWHSFLDAALPHVRLGGVVSGYLARDDLMLQRDDVVVAIRPYAVAVPADCR